MSDSGGERPIRLNLFMNNGNSSYICVSVAHIIRPKLITWRVTITPPSLMANSISPRERIQPLTNNLTYPSLRTILRLFSSAIAWSGRSCEIPLMPCSGEFGP